MGKTSASLIGRAGATSRPTTRRRPATCSTRASPRGTFERSFQLADHVEVKGASLENGLLHVDLVREIPEAMKPRSIPIASSSKLLEVKPTKIAA
jgi:HSP20 family molecular chaperone IbpA